MIDGVVCLKEFLVCQFLSAQMPSNELLPRGRNHLHPVCRRLLLVCSGLCAKERIGCFGFSRSFTLARECGSFSTHCSKTKMCLEPQPVTTLIMIIPKETDNHSHLALIALSAIGLALWSGVVLSGRTGLELIVIEVLAVVPWTSYVYIFHNQQGICPHYFFIPKPVSQISLVQTGSRVV